MSSILFVVLYKHQFRFRLPKEEICPFSNRGWPRLEITQTTLVAFPLQRWLMTQTFSFRREVIQKKRIYSDKMSKNVTQLLGVV